MKEQKCPRCGAEMNRVRCYSSNAMYECPKCEYQDYIPQSHSKILPYGCETLGCEGDIIDVRHTDNGETVLHIKLDSPDFTFKNYHVHIVECHEQA